jgi:hypothetical protein
MVPVVGSPLHIPDIVNKNVDTYISEMNSYILAKFSEAKRLKKTLTGGSRNKNTEMKHL